MTIVVDWDVEHQFTDIHILLFLIRQLQLEQVNVEVMLAEISRFNCVNLPNGRRKCWSRAFLHMHTYVW